MIQDILNDVSRGTLVTVWSLPLIYEGCDFNTKRYMFRYPFSFQYLDEKEEDLRGAVEIAKFECVKETYIRMLSDRIFQEVLTEAENVSQMAVKVFIKAFLPDLKTLTNHDIQIAIQDAQDRKEAGRLIIYNE